jgi:hypothetical protein
MFTPLAPCCSSFFLEKARALVRVLSYIRLLRFSRIFERLLTRSLAEDPRDRFQSISELRDALTDLNLPVILQSGHFTDVGLIRELNEGQRPGTEPHTVL